MDFEPAQDEFNEETKLPRLSPRITLQETAPGPDGEPRWTLHAPLANRFFQIGWAEFECLARLHECETAGELRDRVNAETVLDIEIDDIRALAAFLMTNGLVAGAAAAPSAGGAKGQPLWKTVLHRYLFFTIPLWQPQRFLDATYSLVRPLISRGFMGGVFVVLAIMVVLTLQRWDEFSHTFFNLMSWRGAIMLFVVFAVIKVLHELGHAYTARHYNVPVPHMGIAFMVLYPVLYTETTGVWKLRDRRARMHVGLAGVATEMALAAVALALWHILPPGLGQSLAFSVVAISLIGSLFVNLNPLMRFDGYFVLSDAMGIENMHARGFAFARWWLRKTLFALPDRAPESLSSARRRFLIVFGWATIIYRFFLFLGIALMVYWLFFKPLGLILMIVELWWFIGRPAFAEIKVWWERRSDIWQQKRARIVSFSALGFMLLMVIPWQRSVSVPAVMHAERAHSVYAPAPAQIVELPAQNRRNVQEGEVLVRLYSPALRRDMEAAQARLRALEQAKRRGQTDSALMREELAGIDEAIQTQREKVEALREKVARLEVKAPFDGMVRSKPADLHIGRWVGVQDRLLQVIAPARLQVTAFASEEQRDRIMRGGRSVFYPDYTALAAVPLTLDSVAPVAASSLEWPELSAVFGGDLQAERPDPQAPSNAGHIPRQALYTVVLRPVKNVGNLDGKALVVQRGTARIKAEPYSPAYQIAKKAAALFLRELNLN